MSIQASDLLVCSQALCSAGTEAEHRAAISRGYYGAYHATRGWYAAKLQPGHNAGPTGGMHQKFVNELKNPASAQADNLKTLSRTVGAMLDVIRLSRTRADYSLEEDVKQADASNALSVAKTIIQKISA